MNLKLNGTTNGAIIRFLTLKVTFEVCEMRLVHCKPANKVHTFKRAIFAHRYAMNVTFYGNVSALIFHNNSKSRKL